MRVEFEFGDSKVRISYEGKLEDYYSMDNPLWKMAFQSNLNPFDESIFSKSNMEHFNKAYEKLTTDVMNYYKNVNKVYEEYLKMKKSGSENTPNNKNAIYANGHDIYNYVARYGLANYQIQAVIRLDGNLDFEKLSRAVRLSVVSQPVFGCRFIENEPPYWRLMDNIDETMFCSFEETDNLDEAVQSFLESPLDMDRDPMVKVRLIRSGSYDTLCIKVNHACCDGAGTKEYVQLLSEIYSTIDQKYEIFIPEPAKRTRKDQDRLFSILGIKDPEAQWIPGSEITNATWPFPWKQVQADTSRMVVCRLSQEQLEEIKRYSKAKGATINDLILTAYYRAMPEMGQPVYGEPMDISVTVDLRRYLPDRKTEAIRNFSGSEVTRIALMPDEPFNETLSRVSSMMNEIKSGRPGLQSAIGLERIEKISLSETLAYYKMVSQWPYYCCDKCAPVLSNLGTITNSIIKFGNMTVTDAYIVPPVVRAPGLLLMVSTYNGSMTLAAGYNEGSIPGEDIERLLNRIKNELVEGCKL